MKSKTKNKKGGSIKIENDNELTEQAKLKIEVAVQEQVNKALEDLEKKRKEESDIDIKTKDLLDKLEIDALLNLNIIDSSDYKTNQEYFKNNILGDNSNPDITRMWLMHLLGGGMLATHFINKNGSLRDKIAIDNEILRITSWKGTTTNDYWLYQKLIKIFHSASLKSAYAFSFIKQIYKFIENWVFYISSIRNKKSGLIKTASLGSTLLILYTGYFDQLPILKYLEKIPGVQIILEQIKSEESSSILSKTLSSIAAFGGLVTIFSAIIAFYESFYYNIEREQIKKYLNEGISESTKTQMFIYRDTLKNFDFKIKELAKTSDEEILNILNRAHIKNQKDSGWFSNANSYGKKIYNLLSSYLSKTNREEFYINFKKNLPIVPYAIYFFNQKGEPRTVRDSICAIMVGLDGIDSNTFKELRHTTVISEKRQKDLVPYTGGKTLKKKNIKRKTKTHKNIKKFRI